MDSSACQIGPSLSYCFQPPALHTAQPSSCALGSAVISNNPEGSKRLGQTCTCANSASAPSCCSTAQHSTARSSWYKAPAPHLQLDRPKVQHAHKPQVPVLTQPAAHLKPDQHAVVCQRQPVDPPPHAGNRLRHWKPLPRHQATLRVDDRQVYVTRVLRKRQQPARAGKKNPGALSTQATRGSS
jgi:hypothetical protein